MRFGVPAMAGLAALWIALPMVSGDAHSPLSAALGAAGRSFTPTGTLAQLPAGLGKAASAAVGASQARFLVHRRGAALVASGGGLSTRFGRSGISVTAGGARLGLRVVGLGDGTSSTAGNRVTYHRGDVTEWYANEPLGLEQGFTLAKPLRGGRAMVSLRLSGNLMPRQEGQAVVFTGRASGAVVMRYSDLRAFDATGRTLPARLQLTGRTLQLRVDDRGARYPLTIDPLIQQGAKLTAGGAGAEFGWSASLSNDGNTAVIGAPGVGGDIGAAWVFTRAGSAWTQAAQLTPGAGEQAPPGRYGSGVAISGDGSTALVGSPGDNGVGAAWVFRRAGPTSWPEDTKLIPIPTSENGAGLFGSSVSLSDSGNTALIGGPGDNSGVGAAWIFIFNTSTSTWSQSPNKLTGRFEIGAGRFGSSVALSGDGLTAVIGGPFDDARQSGGTAGTAWVFLGTDGWFEIGTLHPNPGEEDDTGHLGSSVAITKDGNTALVGAPNQAAGAGGAWVFSPGVNGGWTSASEVAMLAPNDESAGGGRFGWSVALSDDGGTALVGGDNDAGHLGAGWVFRSSPAGWTQQGPKLTPTDEAFDGGFGYSAALSQDGTTGLLGGFTDNGTAGAAWPFAAGGGYTVTTTADTVNDANCQIASCTLRQAVNAANLGFETDVITVPAGSYQLSSSFGALVVSKGMTINGAGARATTILGEPTPDRLNEGDRVFDITSTGTPVVIQGLTLSGGTATPANNFFGGNVRNAGVLTLVNDTITNGSAYSGGGLSNNGGTMLVDRTTVSGNQAIYGGGDSGGIQNFGNGTNHGDLTSTNSTISSNTASLGGGVYSWGDNANSTTVANSTIAFNTTGVLASDRGTGGIGGGGTFIFKNSIVSNNTSSGAPSNCVVPPPGTITSQGNNLESASDCGFTASGDIQKTDPQLGPLQDNGGPTDTHAITATSPAFDHGGGCPPPSVDQRGTSRPQGGACDIGAFELFVAAAPPPPASPAAPAAPAIVGEAAPSISAESATVTASVNPNGSATTVVVNYGATASYGQQTAAVAIGSGSVLQVVSQAVTGLAPSTTYHFRFVATSAGGTTLGPDATFTTAVPGGAAAQPPPPPAQGVSANVFPFLGTVLVNGQPLQVGQQIPFGSTVDTTNGTVVLETVVNGVVQEMQFAGGVFQLFQLANGVTQLVLKGGDFSICNASKKSTRHTATAANATTVRRLWGNGKGSFQTKGRYAAATVRGTIYLVADRCDGTFTRVRQGTVSVLDLVLNKTVSVTAPDSYLAKAKKSP
jgi:CSLREA domain-containing protein